MEMSEDMDQNSPAFAGKTSAENGHSIEKSDAGSNHPGIEKFVGDYVTDIIDSATSSFADYSLLKDDCHKTINADASEESGKNSRPESTAAFGEGCKDSIESYCFIKNSSVGDGLCDGDGSSQDVDSRAGGEMASVVDPVVRSLEKSTEGPESALAQLHGNANLNCQTQPETKNNEVTLALNGSSQLHQEKEARSDSFSPEVIGFSKSTAAVPGGSGTTTAFHSDDQSLSCATDGGTNVEQSTIPDTVDKAPADSSESGGEQVINDESFVQIKSLDSEDPRSALPTVANCDSEQKAAIAPSAGYSGGSVGDTAECNSSAKERKATCESSPVVGETRDIAKEEDDWLDILGNGLLRKKILIPGFGKDSRPKRHDEVTITVESKLSDGTLAEALRELTFVLADQEVVNAIDLAVNLMEKGETATVVADPKYCYGPEGKSPNIPPDASLTYTIELLDIRDGPFRASTPIKQRLGWVDRKRHQGNKLYSEKKFAEAAATYKRCTTVLQIALGQDHEQETVSRIRSFSLKCQNNLAASYMMSGDWKDALKACQNAGKIEPNNVRTLLRKGKVLAKLGEFSQAIETLKKANNLDPEDRAIQSELAKCSKKLQDQKESQKRMYKRMFWDNRDPAETDKIPPNRTSSWLPSRSVLLGSSLVALGAVLIGAYFMHR